MSDTFRWGVIGTGFIADTFVRDLALLPDHAVVAVGSRSREAADTFADRHAIPHRHASYADLVADPEVDAVYVATPHPGHHDAALLGIEAGKAVLVEKPFTMDADGARSLVAAARARGTFLMEAMWTRFLPVMVKVRELLAQKAIGEVRAVMADFGFRARFDPQSRLFAPELGGGALLDVGVYVISFASMVLGPKAPLKVASLAQLGETGVDEQSSYILDYGDGVLASLFAAVRTQSPQEAVILGSEGRIRVHSQFYHATRITLSRNGRADQDIEAPFEGNGFNYEAAEVMRCLRSGRTESDVLPLDETLAVMQTMDRIRKPWGLRYPSE